MGTPFCSFAKKNMIETKKALKEWDRNVFGKMNERLELVRLELEQI